MGFQDRRAQIVRWFRIALVVMMVGACSQRPEDLTADVAQLLDEGGADLALAVLERRLDLAPHDSAVRLLRVKLLVETRAVDQALREYQELCRTEGDPCFDLLGRILTVSYTHLTLPTTPYV